MGRPVDGARSFCRASNLQYPKPVQISVLFMTFQYFSENLAYYGPIMLILKPKLQYFSVFLQYFASKISTSTEESVWLEALISASPPSFPAYSILYQRRAFFFLDPLST